MNKDLFGSLKKLSSSTEFIKSFPTEILFSGRKVTDNLEILKLFANSFFPSAKPLTSTTQAQMFDDCTKLTSMPIESFPPITQDEIKRAVFALKSDAAPGEDGLASDLIQLSFNYVVEHLLHIFNNCLKLGYFLVKWKIARIRIIRKANKECYRNTKSYRPISVLNTFCKIFEKILLYRLRWLAVKLSWFSERQHEFLEKKSTETAAHTLVSFVESSFTSKSYTAAVFLDISGAFDSAWLPAIVHALAAKGCPHYLTLLLDSFLDFFLKTALQYYHIMILHCFTECL